MKKISCIIICLMLCAGLLTGCAPEGHVNILLFTDNLNKINPDKKISLSDYLIQDNRYRLIVKNEEQTLLITAEENEKGEIKKIRLALSKTDEKGRLIPVESALADFFRKEAVNILMAYTLSEKNLCEETVKKILPLKNEDFSRTGELTMELEEYHLVYYSNKICSQFTVTNTYLEKTDITEKPVSKPLFGVTATAVEEN